MDYLKALRDDPDLAEEFDSLFDFFLLDELSPRDEADGRCTFSLPGMAFARDGSGGEYHLLEDGSIGYYSSEGEAGRLAESMDDLFSLLVSCVCWHDCCDAKQYVDSKTLEEYGQRQRNCNLEDMDVGSLQRVSEALGIQTSTGLAPVLERFLKATQREPLYQCIFHEDDGGCNVCGGMGPLLGYLPCSPHCKPEVREDNEIHNDYDFFRPVIRVQTSGWRIVSPENER